METPINFRNNIITVTFVAKVPNKAILKVQSCKLYSNKYMIASTQVITNTEKFSFIAVLVLKLLSRKLLFIDRKDNRNC